MEDKMLKWLRCLSMNINEYQIQKNSIYLTLLFHFLLQSKSLIVVSLLNQSNFLHKLLNLFFKYKYYFTDPKLSISTVI